MTCKDEELINSFMKLAFSKNYEAINDFLIRHKSLLKIKVSVFSLLRIKMITNYLI